ncbi:MAG: hypothetical protein V1659_04290 [Candidatus Woesearchaeota archaeon]
MRQCPENHHEVNVSGIISFYALCLNNPDQGYSTFKALNGFVENFAFGSAFAIGFAFDVPSIVDVSPSTENQLTPQRGSKS